MVEKLKFLFFIWIGIIVCYIFIAITNDATSSIATLATTEMESQNLSSEIVGIEEAIGSFDLWKWTIPSLLGIVITAVTLREEILNKVKGE